MEMGRDSNHVPPNHGLQYKAESHQQSKNARTNTLFHRCDLFASKQPYFAYWYGRCLSRSQVSVDFRGLSRDDCDHTLHLALLTGTYSETSTCNLFGF
jgi:hypothetical protein